jgi:hypothetical protein
MANDLTILSSPYGQNVPYRFEAGFDRFVINTFTNASPRQFSLSDFASVEMISQDKRKQAGKTIGGVTVGAILLGPVGAIAGGLLSGNKNEFLVKVVLTNGVEMLCSVRPDAYNAIQSAAFQNSANQQFQTDSATTAQPSQTAAPQASPYGNVPPPLSQIDAKPSNTKNIWLWVGAYILAAFSVAAVNSLGLLMAAVFAALSVGLAYIASKGKKPVRVATIAYVVVCALFISVTPEETDTQETPKTAVADTPTATPSAPAYELVSSTADTKWYVDKNSVKRNGNVVTLSVLADSSKTTTDAPSAISEYSFTCKQGMFDYKTGRFIVYDGNMAKGNKVEDSIMNTSESNVPLKKGYPLGDIASFACGM